MTNGLPPWRGQPVFSWRREKIMDVQQIMTRKIVTVEPDDSLATVREIFANLKFHHLLVVESNRLIGVVSDRDLLKALSPNLGTVSATLKDEATLNKRVHQIMSRRLVTLNPDATIIDAVNLFNTHRISCIPVVDNEYRPLGIVSWRDILKAVVAGDAPKAETGPPDKKPD
jgi:acetoin utilization protein AcuB